MEPFKRHSGLVIPFNRANVDTDAIIPKQYLKMLGKTGYGDFLFDDERYLDPGDVETPIADRRPAPDFILNRTPYDRGTILLAGINFGCGSSREHAVWALRDYGIRVVLAPSFGDIFFNNCFNNGLLPIILGQDIIDRLFTAASQPKGLYLDVDLKSCEITQENTALPFVVEPGRRENLLSGLDDIGRTLAHGDAILNYEARRRLLEPWIFAG
jgi:3-isopropylmalate/(R)-2-methylmalate dehydratase small subunit